MSGDGPSVPNGLEFSSAAADARRYLGDKSELIAICGSSTGVGIYLDNPEEGYTPDGINEGVIIFGLDAEKKPQIVHRDAFKEMVVMAEDGGKITRMPSKADSRLGVWVIEFASSGIVETHNLAMGADDQLYDLWTSNKPKNIMGARSLAFHAKCEFI